VTEISLGVLFDERSVNDEGAVDELDETGHVPAAGHRGARAADFARRVAVVGDEALRAAALAVGHEVASVLTGVVTGIEARSEHDGAVLRTGSFGVEGIELKFGVKTVLGAGKVMEALLTASSEATVEVTVKLVQQTENGEV